MPGRPWRPSAVQLAALRALSALEEGGVAATAAGVGAYTAQSPDGAAYTLRSLVNRGLVTRSGHDGDRWLNYRLTATGRELAERHHAGETPDREAILAILRRFVPGARGVSAADLAAEIRRLPPAQGGNPALTAAGARRQLARLAGEGVADGRVVKSGGAVRYVVTEKHRHPYNAAEVTRLARKVEEAEATMRGLAALACEAGIPEDGNAMAAHAATLHDTAASLRRLARTLS
jgi:DNA-binding MarR family transcriptional regulator